MTQYGDGRVATQYGDGRVARRLKNRRVREHVRVLTVAFARSDITARARMHVTLMSTVLTLCGLNCLKSERSDHVCVGGDVRVRS